MAKKQQAAPLPSQLMDIAGIQQFLNVSRAQVYRLIEQDSLPYVKVGNARRFDPRQIDAWLAERTQRAS